MRPAREAAQIASWLDLDIEKIAECEEHWKTTTLPYLQSLPLIGRIRAEIARRIEFGQKRMQDAVMAYASSLEPFRVRRRLMEQKVPICKEYLALYEGWMDQLPYIDWQPQDVVDLRERGVEWFVRFNLERFFGQMGHPSDPF